jgi:hypothetical protein
MIAKNKANKISLYGASTNDEKHQHKHNVDLIVEMKKKAFKKRKQQKFTEYEDFINFKKFKIINFILKIKMIKIINEI